VQRERPHVFVPFGQRGQADRHHVESIEEVAPEAAALETYAWPGNIRELSNVIERLVLLTDDTVISAGELARFLPSAGRSLPPDRSDPAPGVVREYRELRSHSAEELRAALARHGGNRSRAAQTLGLTVRQFTYRLTKLG